MSQISRLVLTGALALATAGAAHATSSVVSTLSNLTVKTTGTVTASALYASTYVSAYDLVQDSLGSWSSVNAAYDYSYEWSATSTSVASDSAVATASVSSTAVSATATTGAAGGYAYASAYLSGSFSLAAKSSVTLTWDASVVGENSGNKSFLAYDSANGSVNVSLGSVYSSTYASAYTYWWDDEDFGFSFEETATGKKLTVSAGTKGRDIGFSASAYAQTTDYAPAPVPEPQTWALTLAGLAVMGGIARRRSAK